MRESTSTRWTVLLRRSGEGVLAVLALASFWRAGVVPGVAMTLATLLLACIVWLDIKRPGVVRRDARGTPGFTSVGRILGGFACALLVTASLTALGVLFTRLMFAGAAAFLVRELRLPPPSRSS